ncbi:hypothetical protein SLEP1_g7205 [Rubroshorea leprosula]|uniref:Uncharacterized protein n=1 Tax=Rubroshorea leprosula TaxID=152421 RepID=A0AAV5I6P6_9ROSI|nr:hypothetical protein SLEP1_g7205 [Rubroshorea leprosula]
MSKDTRSETIDLHRLLQKVIQYIHRFCISCICNFCFGLK